MVSVLWYSLTAGTHTVGTHTVPLLDVEYRQTQQLLPDSQVLRRRELPARSIVKSVLSVLPFFLSFFVTVSPFSPFLVFFFSYFMTSSLWMCWDCASRNRGRWIGGEIRRENKELKTKSLAMEVCGNETTWTSTPSVKTRDDVMRLTEHPLLPLSSLPPPPPFN